MSEICVHLYALCWNEERMLPFFFRHYDSLVDRYFIFDNDSTDGSRERLLSHPRVTLGHFSFGASFLENALEFYDHCWKASRGTADWVLVCNVDEHIDHPDLRGYLQSCRDRGITLIVTDGYEMVSETFPAETARLASLIRKGAPQARYLKPQLFNPDQIREIHFEPGRHSARPEGVVCCPLQKEVKLLHYKYLGEDYTCQRLAELGQRIPRVDIPHPQHHYRWHTERTRSEFRRLRETAKHIE